MSIEYKKFGRTIQKMIIIGITSSILLVGCDLVSMFQSNFQPENPSSDVGETDDDGTQVEQDATETPTPQPVDNKKEIIVWIPPQFDPQTENVSAQIFNAHINEFLEDYRDLTIDFRVKAESGLNSILDALSITASAAPDALPTVVLLSREDMMDAADLGLINPIEFVTDELEESNWFDVSREMGIYKEEVFGLPFAADAIVLVTRDDQLSETYFSLPDLRQQRDEFGYDAGNSNSLVPFLWYESMGATLVNENGEPQLEEQYLNVLFSELSIDKRLGIFSPNILDYLSQEMVWEAFLNRQIGSLFTWYSDVENNTPEYKITYAPSFGENAFTYADGWVWCLVQNESADYGINVAFMEYMVSEEFIREWSQDSSYLPVRFSNQDQTRDFISDLMRSAVLPPDDAVREYSKEALALAVKQIISEERDVQIVTRELVNQLEQEKAP